MKRLKQTYNFIKKHAIKFFIGIGLIGVATAAPLIIPVSDGIPAPNSFKISERNFDGVQYEVLRRELDPYFNTLADELSISYYDYWQHGQRKDFQGYNLLKDTVSRKDVEIVLAEPIAKTQALLGTDNGDNRTYTQSDIDQMINGLVASYQEKADKQANKDQFDNLHGLIWHKYNVEFDKQNDKQNLKYTDEGIKNRAASSIEMISKLNIEGIDVVIPTINISPATIK